MTTELYVSVQAIVKRLRTAATMDPHTAREELGRGLDVARHAASRGLHRGVPCIAGTTSRSTALRYHLGRPLDR